MKLKKITNKKKQQFLESNAVYPVYEEYEAAYYKPTKKLLLLLEDYDIKYYCFPNKFTIGG